MIPENHYYSEFHNDITYRYIIRIRLKSNRNWKQQYPILVREKQTTIRKFLTWFGIGPYEEPSIDTPYLDQEKTVKIAQKIWMIQKYKM